MIKIDFNPNLNANGGYLNVTPDNIGTNDQTLLHAIFWAVYTHPGRDFMHSLTLEADGSFSAANEQKLRNKLNEFGVNAEAIVFAFVQAHVAALRWKVAHAAHDAVQEEIQTKAYQQYTALLTWSLWEDAQGHEFSMTW